MAHVAIYIFFMNVKFSFKFVIYSQPGKGYFYLD